MEEAVKGDSKLISFLCSPMNSLKGLECRELAFRTSPIKHDPGHLSVLMKDVRSRQSPAQIHNKDVFNLYPTRVPPHCTELNFN